MVEQQRTIAKPVTVSGIGIHTGTECTMTFKPAPENYGIRFIRVDLGGNPEIPAIVENVVDVSRGTTIAVGEAKVHTVEHVLAAVYGLKIDNLKIELDGIEPPIGDGSAKLYVDALLEAGIVEQEAPKDYLVIDQTVMYHDEERGIDIVALPLDDFRITIMIDYNNPALGSQHSSLFSLEKEFITEYSTARTFCFLSEVEQLVNQNLIKGGDIDNAIECYNRSIKIDPTYVMAYNNLGIAMLHKNKTDEALKMFNKSLQIRDDYVDALLNLSIIFIENKNFVEAKKYIDKVLEIKGDYPLTYNYLGIIYREEGKYEDAIKVFEKAIQYDENFAEAYYNLAFTLTKVGRYEDALKYTKEALRLNPYYVETRYKLGLDYYADKVDVLISGSLSKDVQVTSSEQLEGFSMGEEKSSDIFTGVFEEETDDTFEREDVKLKEVDILEEKRKKAKESFQKGEYDMALQNAFEVVRKDENDVEMFEIIGDVYNIKEIYGEAEEYYRKVVALSPLNENVVLKLSKLLYNKGIYSEPIEYISKIVERDRNRIDVLNLYSMLLWKDGNLEEAIKIIGEILLKDPENVETLTNLSEIYVSQGRDNDALEIYERILKKDSENLDILYKKALVLRRMKMFDDSIKILESLISKDVDNLNYLWELATVYELVEDYEKSIQIYTRIVQIDPTNLKAFLRIGSVCIEIENIEVAKYAYQNALKLDPTNPEANFNFAKIIAKEGYIKEAIERWNSVLKNSPESEFAQKSAKAIEAARNWISIFE